MAPKEGGTRSRQHKSPGPDTEASCSMSALMTNQKSPRVNSVRGKVMNFKDETDGCVDQTDDDGSDERRAEPAHLDAGNKIGDDQ